MTKGVRPVLLSMIVGDETAVIERDDAELVLVARPPFRAVDLVAHAPAAVELRGGIAVGGRLPPGATRAEVVDDAGARHRARVGSGVYLAVLAGAGFEGLVHFANGDSAP